MKIYDLAFTSAGDNLKEAGNDWEITSDYNIFGIEDRNTLSFGFVRNTGMSRPRLAITDTGPFQIRII